MIVLTSVFSVFVLFLMTKLLGNKQISQLSMFDYVIGISIGSIAAEMATELTEPINPLIAIVVYSLLGFFISFLTNKSLSARKLFTGKPIVLMDAGALFRDNFKKARFDIGDFLTLCRVNGYFDINDIETAILEENGTLSILPKSRARPVTPEDLKLFPEQQKAVVPLILDGAIIDGSLSALKKDADWLAQQLKNCGFSDPKKIFYAYANEKMEVTAYSATPSRSPRTAL